MTKFFLKVKTLFGNFSKDNYGSELQKYILSHNPKHHSDIDKLTMEFNNLIARSRIV